MPDKLVQLKQKYINSFEQKHNDIEASWEKKDFPQLEYLLHKLSGSSGSYGFSRLNLLCQHAENIIKQNHELNHSELAKIMTRILHQLHMHQ